ncbi:nucleolin 1-like isoform X2 [Ipomoea triloba]|uniref:nucleolin 1-like isoform X2 n=1 Tax=Ipomoea triloba TaxID=35885 RepID=UPI00125DAD47|nr:nucleolin 1-like isoform X2 [Ipomoea triloba]
MASTDAPSSGSNVNARASLSLDEEEDEGMVIGIDEVNEDGVEYKYMLVGKLLTDKPIKFKVLRDTIAATWRPVMGMMMNEAEYNLFVFQFFHQVDMKRVMEDGPWCFDQSLLVLHRMQPSECPNDIPLCKAEFWVQVHKLPIGFFTENIAKAIGDYLGEFIRADRRNFEGSWKSFLRVRALLDLTKPLRRRVKMKKEGGDWFWAEFKYERLPHFCFLCGLMGHTERYCERMLEGVTEETVRPYGSWLRATGRRFPAIGSRWLVEERPRRAGIQTPQPQEVVNPNSLREEIQTPQPQEVVSPNSSREEIQTPQPQEVVSPNSSREEIQTPQPQEVVNPNSGREEIQTPQPQEALELNDQQLLGQEVELDLAKERGADTPNSGEFDNSFQKQGSGGGESSSEYDDDDSSDESEDEEPQNKNTEASTTETTVKQSANDSKDETSYEDESSDDEPSEAEWQSSTGKESSSDDYTSEESSDEEEDAPSKTPKKKTPDTPRAESQGSRSLFMGNLSWSIVQADVENFFKDCGEVKDVRFASHRDGMFKGYGHVEFTTSEAAAKALELNGQQLLGREVRLGLAKERGAYTLNSGEFDNSFQKQGRGGGESTIVFVKGFDKNDIEDKIRSALEDHFGSCGEIKGIRIPTDPEGCIKGMAYIEFTDSDAMNKALELNNSQIGNNTLYVDDAKPRGDSRGGGGERGGRFGGRGGGRFGRGGGRFGLSRGVWF